MKNYKLIAIFFALTICILSGCGNIKNEKFTTVTSNELIAKIEKSDMPEHDKKMFTERIQTRVEVEDKTVKQLIEEQEKIEERLNHVLSASTSKKYLTELYNINYLKEDDKKALELILKRGFYNHYGKTVRTLVDITKSKMDRDLAIELEVIKVARSLSEVTNGVWRTWGPEPAGRLYILTQFKKNSQYAKSIEAAYIEVFAFYQDKLVASFHLSPHEWRDGYSIADHRYHAKADAVFDQTALSHINELSFKSSIVKMRFRGNSMYGSYNKIYIPEPDYEIEQYGREIYGRSSLEHPYGGVD